MTRLGRLVATAILALGVSAPLAMAQTVEGNAGGMQMQEQLVNELKRFGVDYPAGSYMTLEQISELQALIQNNRGDETAIKSGAEQILGM